MSTKMKFKCTSCQHIFEHDAYQKECFCPKCGNTSERCAEEEQFIVCSECGTEIPNGATSCPTCGCPISATKNRHCHECGAELADCVHVCPQCGCPVVPAAPVIEYTAKITLPNGEVIEKTVSTAGTFPSPKEQSFILVYWWYCIGAVSKFRYILLYDQLF